MFQYRNESGECAWDIKDDNYAIQLTDSIQIPDNVCNVIEENCDDFELDSESRYATPSGGSDYDVDITE